MSRTDSNEKNKDFLTHSKTGSTEGNVSLQELLERIKKEKEKQKQESEW